MKAAPAGMPSASLFARIAWFALAAIILCTARVPWNLEEYDQAKQAFVALEMVSDGSWLMQHTPAGYPATKPPLAGWFSAAVYAVAGCWDLAWRLPSMLSAGALFLAISKLGRAAGGSVGMWTAEAVFVFNMLTPRVATLVRTDMLLTLFIALSTFVCYRAVHDRRCFTLSEWCWLMLLSAGSFLTKGPILYAFLLPTIFGYAVWQREFRILWQTLLATLPGLGFFLVWVSYCAKDPHFYELVVVKEFLGRFNSGDDAPHKSQPIYFYIAQLIHKLLPWSLVVPATLLHRRIRRRLPTPGARLLVCAVIAPLAVMSFLPSKRVDRIYPILPPLCILAAIVAPACDRRWVAGTIAASVLGWTAYEASVVYRGFQNDEHWLVRFGENVRATTANHGWTVGLVRTNEEGIYLYLRTTRALNVNAAAAALKAGEIQAVVVQRDRLPHLEEKFGAPLQILLTAHHDRARHSGLALVVPKPAD